jgi:competence protein ComEA
MPILKKLLAAVAALCATVALAAVDVNKASEAELDGVKGVGPATSKLILSERKKGEFKSWDDFISRVKGVGDSRATKLSADGLTVNGQAYTAAKPAAADSAKKPVTEKMADGAKAAGAKTKEVAKDAKSAMTPDSKK